jgi:hypothetical protein
MHTMHPTLLIGPADWEAAQMSEFADRMAQLRRHRPDMRGAVIYGNPYDHAALAYFTHLTPKLEAALALIPREGPPRLMVGGGANMIPAARPLTFIEDVVPLRQAGKAVAAWAQSLPPVGEIIVLNGAAMPAALYHEIETALAGIPHRNEAVCGMYERRARKAERELAFIREACRMLDAAVSEMAQAKRNGAAATAALLAAEHAAHRLGAQDVRSLVSLDGGVTLRPFEDLVERPVDPLQAYLAVRHAGYWADGFVMLSDRPHPPLEAARRALRMALEAIPEGGNMADVIADAIQPRRLHPMIGAIMRDGLGPDLGDFARDLAPSRNAATPQLSRVAVSVGLAIDDCGRSGTSSIESGGVLSLRAGVLGDDGAAIVSAMVAGRGGGQAPEVLWSAADVGEASP